MSAVYLCLALSPCSCLDSPGILRLGLRVQIWRPKTAVEDSLHLHWICAYRRMYGRFSIKNFIQIRPVSSAFVVGKKSKTTKLCTRKSKNLISKLRCYSKMEHTIKVKMPCKSIHTPWTFFHFVTLWPQTSLASFKKILQRGLRV